MFDGFPLRSHVASKIQGTDQKRLGEDTMESSAKFQFFKKILTVVTNFVSMLYNMILSMPVSHESDERSENYLHPLYGVRKHLIAQNQF